MKGVVVSDLHLEKKPRERRCDSTVYIHATRNACDNDGYDCDYDDVSQQRIALATFLEGVHLIVLLQCVQPFPCAGVYLVVSVVE